MADYGHDWTEERLKELEERIAREYKKASREMQESITEYFETLEKRDEKYRKMMEAGKITPEHYTQWRLNQIGRGQRMEALRDALAERMTKANQTAVAYVNDATPGIYSLNRNYAAYTIEQVAGDVGFTLWDEQTVRRLVVEQPDLMPYYPAARALQRGIDLAWGKKQITAQLTSGILLGESIKKLSDRLQYNIPNMNRTSAIRTARTAVTGAQNAGRQETYSRAEKMGIKVYKRWIATKDNRTRHSHAMVDGETIGYKEVFSNGLLYPGDPSGPGHEVYNCRCTLRTVEKEGIEAEPRQMRVRDPATGENMLISEMTYGEWEEWKKGAAPTMYHRRVTRDGRTIIDKATYHKITNRIIKKGATIVTADEKWLEHLEKNGATAVTIGNIIILRPDATVTEVLEEAYHFEQNRKKQNSQYPYDIMRVLNEIDAQKYLIAVAEKYKIPLEEQKETQALLKKYEEVLGRYRREGRYHD